MSEATAPHYERIADRPSTFAAWIAHANATSEVIGCVRLDDQIRWVARTLGSASQVADIRRFRDHYAASVWLQEAVDGVYSRRPRVAA
jgi:hypothetical protein